MKINSLEDLNQYREAILQQRAIDSKSGQIRVILSMGTPAVAAGARATLKAIIDFINEQNLENISVIQSGNIGFDSFEPIVLVEKGEQPKVAYGNVTPDAARRIMSEHVEGGEIVAELQIEI